VIEYARNVCGLSTANSEEFDEETAERVVVFMPEIDKTKMGGTMRLGARMTRFKVCHSYRTKVGVNSEICVFSHLQDRNFILPKLYEKLWGDSESVMERHRHRHAQIDSRFFANL
jgi:CTP synthase (UTP-ammonia lyase)